MLSINLRRIRRSKDISQQEVADFLGISRQAYSLYETGARSPKPDTLSKLSTYFCVSADYLLGADKDEPDSPGKTNVVDNISRLLAEKRLPQKALTDSLGLEKSAFSEWKCGKSKSYMKYIAQISSYLNVSVDYLLGADSGEPETASDISESAKLEFADRLKRALQAKRMKQVDVVEASRRYSKEYGSAISKSDMSQYLSGLHYPSSAKALILSAVLDVSPAWLLGLNGDIESEGSETDGGMCDTAENKQIFSDNLLYYMRKDGISRQDLSNSLQIKYSTLCEWISAKKYPRIDSIEKIAGFFHITKSDLIEKRTVHISEASSGKCDTTENASEPPLMYRQIEAMCDRNGITVTQLCEECGIARASMSELKAGRTKELSVSALYKIAKYFQTPMEYFVFDHKLAYEELLKPDPKGPFHAAHLLTSSFGVMIHLRLSLLQKDCEWLVEELQRRLPDMYVDRAALGQVLAGDITEGVLVDTIRSILDITQGDSMPLPRPNENQSKPHEPSNEEINVTPAKACVKVRVHRHCRCTTKGEITIKRR